MPPRSKIRPAEKTATPAFALEEIAESRMQNLGLSAPSFRGVAETVRWLGAVQAQDYGPAKWALGLRAPTIDDKAVEKALSAGEIIRTHVLRPTWHFVPNDDLRWMLAFTGPRIHAKNTYMLRKIGLDDAALRKSSRVIASALKGGNQLTRVELAGILTAAGFAAKETLLTYHLMYAELTGVLCSGPRKGKHHSYMLLEERVPEGLKFSGDAALAELAKRYFQSHGPATIDDFAWWSGLGKTEAKRGIELLGSTLAVEKIEGMTFWRTAIAKRKPSSAEQAYVLQGYDEYIVGYRESKWALDLAGRARARVTSRESYVGLVLLGSQLAGHWKRSLRAEEIEFEMAVYDRCTRSQREALELAAERYGKFFGGEATLKLCVLS